MAITVGCIVSGCSNDELLQRLDGLQTELIAQGKKIDEVQTQNTQLTEKLGEMQAMLDEQAKEIENLKLKSASSGKFYAVEEAYENGFLTLEDLKSIAYYNNGGRRYNEAIMSETYAPVPKIPEALSEGMQLIIKSTAAKEFNKIFNTTYAEAKGFRITQYFGIYGDCVAVIMLNDYSGIPGVIWTETIANVNFNNIIEIQIWRALL